MVQRIGVLALQGNYAVHQQALKFFSINAPLVYRPEQLRDLDGLIVPGGESTALLKLMTPLNWQEAIIDFKQAGKKLFGTCAGTILFAQDVVPKQTALNLIEISVSRNAYGRQLESHVAMGACDETAFGFNTCEMVFIRAPKIIKVSAAVTVLATCEGLPVLVQQENVLCATFHPEFLQPSFVHNYFLHKMFPL